MTGRVCADALVAVKTSSSKGAVGRWGINILSKGKKKQKSEKSD